MTTPLIPKRANSELVALAYLKVIVAHYDTVVAATLQGPDPDTQRLSWTRGGFIQASGITGSIDAYVPIRQSVVSLDIFAAPAGTSKRPPWGLAFSVAELVTAWTFDTAAHDTHSVVTLPTGFPNARVTGFRALTEPTRRTSDPADWAHVGMDVQLSWHGLSDTWSADHE